MSKDTRPAAAGQRTDLQAIDEAVPMLRADSTPEQLPLRQMVSFRYASTEVFAEGGQMHVHMKQTHYQDGRLHSEECEGTVDRAAAERMVAQAQQQFISQAFGVVRLMLAPFLGWPRK